jgi:Holliday junction resolvase RusA-like endonuclease
MTPAPFLTDDFIRWLDPECPEYERARVAIIHAFNSETNGVIDPLCAPNSPELIEVVAWLNKLEIDGVETGFRMRRSKLRRLFSACLSSKVVWLAQHNCDLCDLDLPIVTIPIRIRPRSYQASKTKIKNAFKSAIATRLANFHKFSESRLCIHIVIVCGESSRSTGDVDNIAKLMLDAMKGVVFDDDRQVDHLSVLRVRECGDEDYVYLHIGRSTLNQHRDVLFAGVHHSWAVGAPINLDEYL